ncbi:MAG: type II secretion system protein [Candidatus Uhrbacteria bacterium]|nr:type II secretion system protein [Candidatus Uhrbacteria bacterium]
MKKGFTLIELMIVLAIISILAVVVGGMFRGCSAVSGSKQEAMATMRTYATEMGWKMVGGTCADTDSDGDGYISCTINVQEVEGAPPVAKALQCASGAAISRTGGCKLAQGVYQQQ